MKNSHAASRQHGLTLLQWAILIVAFMVGLGGSFLLREICPPASVHAGVIQAVSVDSDFAR